MQREQAAAQKDQLHKLWKKADGQMQVLERMVRMTPLLPPLALEVTVHWMGKGDDPQVFLKAFWATGEVRQWPAAEWCTAAAAAVVRGGPDGTACHQPHEVTSGTSVRLCWIAWKIIAGGSGPAR